MLINFFEKIKVFLKKQSISKISLLFIIFISLSIIYLTYKDNRDRIYLTIKTKTIEDLSLITAYRISSEGKIKELKGSGSTQYSSTRFVKKIWISFPTDKIKDINEIQINIGDKTFKFFEKDLSEFKIIDETGLIKLNEKNEIIEIPAFVRGEPSLFLNFLVKDSVNWKGDFLFIKNSVIYFSCLVLLVILSQFSFANQEIADTNNFVVIEEKTVQRNRRIDFGLGLLTVNSVVGIYNFMFFNRFFSVSDGWWGVAAHYINDGKMPYRDFYLYPPPLYPLMVAGFTHLFGYEFLYCRILGILIMLIMSTLLFFIFIKFIPVYISSFVTILTMVIFQSPPWNATYDFNTLVYVYILIAALFFYNYLNLRGSNIVKSSANLLFCGLFISILFLSKQSGGVFSVLVFVYLIIAINRKQFIVPFLIFMAGLSLPIIPVAIWLLKNDALMFFWQQVFVDAGDNKGGLCRILFAWLPTLCRSNLLIYSFINLLMLYFFWGKGIFSLDIPKNDWVGSLTGKKRLVLFLFIFLSCLYALVLPVFAKDELTSFVADLFIVDYFAESLPGTATILMFVWFIIYSFKSLSGNRNRSTENILVFLGISIVTFLFVTASGQATSLLATVIILGMLFGLLISGKSRLRIIRVLFICIGLCLIVSVSRLRFPLYSWLGVETPKFSETNCSAAEIKYLKGFRLDKRSIEIFSGINEIVQKNTEPTDTIFTFPRIPIFYLMNNRYPSTFAFVHWYDVTSDKVCHDDAARLKQFPPKIIILLQDYDNFAMKSQEKGFRREGEECGQREILKVLQELTSNLSQYELEKEFHLANSNSIMVWKRLSL